MSSNENFYIGEEIQVELDAYRARGWPTIGETRNIMLSWLDGYAYNMSELCRIINGFAPHQMGICHCSFKEKPFGTSGPTCRHKEHGCRIFYVTLVGRIKSLVKGGFLRRLKIRWFDSRPPGAAETHFPTDTFVYIYTDPGALGLRLINDVKVHLGDPIYE